MNFSEEYLYENFKKNYEAALSANGKGKLKVAKEKFLAAAGFLEQLAFLSNGSERDKYAGQAERLKKIADAIDAEQPACGVDEEGDGSGEREQSERDGEMASFLEFYTPDELSVGFEGVIGLESAKHAVTEYIINPIRYPDA